MKKTSCKTLQRLCLACLLLAAAGCTAPPSKTPPPPTDQAPAAFPVEAYEAAAASGQQIYRIDPASSRLLLEVYRGGRLARLGHNHTIASGQVAGLILLAEPLTDSRADLYVPVASLIVDTPEDREAAGAAFTKPVDASAAEATRNNLLSEAVLDAQHHPYVQASIRVTGARDDTLDLSVEIEVRGTRKRIPCTARIDRQGDELLVEAALRMKQSDFGITPFSVLNGALTVEDQLDLVVNLRARPVAAQRIRRR